MMTHVLTVAQPTLVKPVYSTYNTTFFRGNFVFYVHGDLEDPIPAAILDTVCH